MPGVTSCDDFGYHICIPQFNAAVEVCNGIDDDCNGEIDEGNPDGGELCEVGDPGVCNIGEWTYISGALGCMPLIQVGIQDEICNGLDDDCDDDIDEALDGNLITETCYTGPEGTSGDVDDCEPFNATIYPGNTEICNAIDDNCDTFIDEGCP
ncbi:putative metal-binding motif-containing protein [Myxococcota bacterium]|nr:putative metal-binding motif-containing protein [Myxococcota bacterium]